MVLNVHREHKAYYGRGEGGGGGRRGYGGGGRGKLYTGRYTVTTIMTPPLRWAATRAILVLFLHMYSLCSYVWHPHFSLKEYRISWLDLTWINCEGQSHNKVSTNHNLFERERWAEAESSRGPSAYQPNALPLGQTGSRRKLAMNIYILTCHCHNYSLSFEMYQSYRMNHRTQSRLHHSRFRLNCFVAWVAEREPKCMYVFAPAHQPFPVFLYHCIAIPVWTLKGRVVHIDSVKRILMSPRIERDFRKREKQQLRITLSF